MSPRYLLAAMVVAAALTGCSNPDLPLGPGEVAPPIAPTGWIDGTGPTAEELRGSVVVLDMWAYWCGPCREKAPELVAAYERFQDRGVRFVGMTHEDARSLTESRAFLDEAGIEWPNGYGAEETMAAYRVTGIPTVFVIGRDGRIAWNNWTSGDLDTAIEEALAAPAP